MTVTTGRIVVTDQLEPVRWMGETGRFLLTSEDTGGLYTFMDITTAPRGGPPLHIHEGEDEAFLVLDGEYEIRLADETHLARAGTLVYGPRGVPHSFRNVGPAPARMLVVATPGGVEGFFKGLSGILAEGGRPDWDAVKELAARHRITGLELPGPPPPGVSDPRPVP